MTNFQLHPNLASKPFVIDLPLCRVLLENNKHYPWLFLVPRRPNLLRLIDLSEVDQHMLLPELNAAQKMLLEHFRPDQLNVAAIGNKTPQLHIHVVARFQSDPAWPGTVWDHGDRLLYTPGELEHMIALIRTGLNT